MTVRSRSARFAGSALVSCAAVVLAAGPAAAAPAAPAAEVLWQGLSSPKGLTLLAVSGNPVVAQGAFGPPGPVLFYDVDDPRNAPPQLGGPMSLMDIAHAGGPVLWLLGSDAKLRLAVGDNVEEVLDIPAYQVTDPDPEDQEDNPEESNPYGLASFQGDAFVADAAGNDLLRVTQDGSVTTVATFAPELVSTDQAPIPGLPPFINAESVPTGVTVGADGMIYVGELKGFPFRPRSSRIYRIDPNAEGARCAASGSSGGCSLYRSGFTAIQDIALDPAGVDRALYVYELAKGGVFEFEAGFETGEFPPAVLLRVSGNSSRELAKGLLSQPGGVSVGPKGLFVTDGIFGNGRLLRVNG
jgi:hypothetical protein